MILLRINSSNFVQFKQYRKIVTV